VSAISGSSHHQHEKTDDLKIDFSQVVVGSVGAVGQVRCWVGCLGTNWMFVNDSADIVGDFGLVFGRTPAGNTALAGEATILDGHPAALAGAQALHGPSRLHRQTNGMHMLAIMAACSKWRGHAKPYLRCLGKKS
jgi:hypothetical protein